MYPACPTFPECPRNFLRMVHTNYCQACGTPAHKVCACCHAVAYCSAKCQAHDWHGFHRLESESPELLAASLERRAHLRTLRTHPLAQVPVAAEPSGTSGNSATASAATETETEDPKKDAGEIPTDEPDTTAGEDFEKIRASWSKTQQAGWTHIMKSIEARYEIQQQLMRTEAFVIQGIERTGLTIDREALLAAKLEYTMAIDAALDALFARSEDQVTEVSARALQRIEEACAQYVQVFAAPLKGKVVNNPVDMQIDSLLDGFSEHVLSLVNARVAILTPDEIETLRKQSEELFGSAARDDGGTSAEEIGGIGEPIGAKKRPRSDSTGGTGDLPPAIGSGDPDSVRVADADRERLGNAAQLLIEGAVKSGTPGRGRLVSRLRKITEDWLGTRSFTQAAVILGSRVAVALLFATFATQVYNLLQPNMTVLDPTTREQFGSQVIKTWAGQDRNVFLERDVSLLNGTAVREISEDAHAAIAANEESIQATNDALEGLVRAMEDNPDLRLELQYDAIGQRLVSSDNVPDALQRIVSGFKSAQQAYGREDPTLSDRMIASRATQVARAREDLASLEEAGLDIIQEDSAYVASLVSNLPNAAFEDAPGLGSPAASAYAGLVNTRSTSAANVQEQSRIRAKLEGVVGTGDRDLAGDDLATLRTLHDESPVLYNYIMTRENAVIPEHVLDRLDSVSMNGHLRYGRIMPMLTDATSVRSYATWALRAVKFGTAFWFSNSGMMDMLRTILVMYETFDFTNSLAVPIGIAVGTALTGSLIAYTVHLAGNMLDSIASMAMTDDTVQAIHKKLYESSVGLSVERVHKRAREAKSNGQWFPTLTAESVRNGIYGLGGVWLVLRMFNGLLNMLNFHHVVGNVLEFGFFDNPGLGEVYNFISSVVVFSGITWLFAYAASGSQPASPLIATTVRNTPDGVVTNRTAVHVSNKRTRARRSSTSVPVQSPLIGNDISSYAEVFQSLFTDNVLSGVSSLIPTFGAAMINIVGLHRTFSPDGYASWITGGVGMVLLFAVLRARNGYLANSVLRGFTITFGLVASAPSIMKNLLFSGLQERNKFLKYGIPFAVLFLLAYDYTQYDFARVMKDSESYLGYAKLAPDDPRLPPQLRYSQLQNGATRFAQLSQALIGVEEGYAAQTAAYEDTSKYLQEFATQIKTDDNLWNFVEPFFEEAAQALNITLV